MSTTENAEQAGLLILIGNLYSLFFNKHNVYKHI